MAGAYFSHWKRTADRMIVERTISRCTINKAKLAWFFEMVTTSQLSLDQLVRIVSNVVLDRQLRHGRRQYDLQSFDASTEGPNPSQQHATRTVLTQMHACTYLSPPVILTRCVSVLNRWPNSSVRPRFPRQSDTRSAMKLPIMIASPKAINGAAAASGRTSFRPG